MTTKPSRIHRFAAADDLLDSLLGKGGKNIVEQYVKTHHHEIAALLAGGMSASRAAKLLAVPLSVPPRRVFGALKTAGFVTESDAAAVAQRPAELVIEQPTPKRSGDAAVLAPAKPVQADAASPAPKPAKAAQAAVAPSRPASPAIPAQSLPDLPDWADGSDRRADESDADYRLRKAIEGAPTDKNKFIGESPGERADALLKKGKLDFGAAGPTEGDRKIVLSLIERFGADAVERQIDSVRQSQPGNRLYPSTLREKMTGHV
jgi:hypothetical protein